MYFLINSDQTTSYHKVGNRYLLLERRMTYSALPPSWVKDVLINRGFSGAGGIN